MKAKSTRSIYYCGALGYIKPFLEEISLRKLLTLIFALLTIANSNAQECATLSDEWLNPAPGTVIFNYLSGRLTGIPDPANSNNPTDSKTIFEGFTSPTPGTTPVGAVTLGLGFLSDANNNVRFDVMVYNDNSGRPGTQVGGVTGLSPTALGVPSNSFKEVLIELPSLPVPTTSRFYVGVVIHPGDAGDQLIVESNSNGQGNGDNSNSISTTKYGIERILAVYSRDIDLKILPKLGVYKDASFSYGSSSYCSSLTDPTPTISGDAGGTFTSSPAGLSLNSSTGKIDLSASTGGTYTIRYSIAGSCPVSETQTVSISAPNADFTVTPIFSCGPLTVNFTDASSISGANTIVDWAWDFGDGSTSTNQNPSHVYDKPGNYTVKLKITDSGGCTHEKTRTNYVQVLGPDVEFIATSATQLDGPGAVTFQSQTTSSAPITNWAWSFGDGSTSNLVNPTHTYTTSGTFDVSLTVTDLDGCSRILTKTNYVNTISGAFDISKAIFEGNEDRFSVAAQESEPRSMAFNLDGTKLYVMGSSGDDINEYNLSVAYDVTSAVYAGDAERFSVAAEETAPRSFAFNNDGSKMFVIGTIGDDVNEYNLSTAFDVSTAVFAGNAERFSVTAQETNPTSLTFNHDGTKMYVAGSDNDAVNEYILSEAFDVSSATYSKRLLIGTQESFPQSIVFVDNGLNLLVMGSSGDDINQYTLTTAFDLSTATFAGNATRFSVASEDGQPNSVTFNSDGTKMFVLGFEGKDINEYSLAAPVITDAVANQAVNDNATISPFSAITVADPNGDNVSATITLDDNAKGVLSGTGLTGSGPYTLASTDAASLQASLRALVFNPTDNRIASGSTEKTTLTIQVSDGERNETDANTTVISSPVAPTVSLSSLATSPTNGFGITITFSEAVTGFAIGDITVANGTASNFSATSTSVYTAQITPTTDGTVTVDVASASAQDAGGVDNTAATQFSITADVTAPTITITSTVPDPTNNTFTAIFTFSEAVTGFLIGDITLGNATASNFNQTSTSVYTADITPTTDGTVTIDVAANVAEDAATNGNTAATQFSVEADLTNPVVTITSSVADPTNGTFSATFTFSEDVTGFVIGDITLGNATASNFSQTSASVYTADITPATDGTVTIDVAANVAEDAATNGNTAATQFSVEADLTNPDVTITSAVADPTNGAFIATFTFSEDVTGFVIGDITLGNATASNFSQSSPSVYTADITPTTDGMVTVDVAANVAEDAATNGNTAATQFSVEADLTDPDVTITSAIADPTNGTFAATFTFSENVTGFVLGDLTLGNATASNFSQTSASVYTADITPTTDGTVTIDVAANVAEDAATNGNTAATQFSLEADLTNPDVTITSAVADPTNGNFSATFTFSEDVTGFLIGDITLGNATASNFNQTSASVYTADITPTTDGTVTIDVAANVAEDAATNGNTAATQLSVEADLTNPGVTITSAVADPTNGMFTATFTFSEDVTGFVIGDITLGNATASNFSQTSASVYTADITPTTDGTVTIDVAVNLAEDAATNGNTAATQFSVEADLTDPGLTITSSVADPTNGTFIATFTFSEDVTGFVIGDITLVNATSSNFSQTSASVYTADITPTTDGTVTIDVAANMAEDAATNGNTAATQFSVEADLTNPGVTITSAVADPTSGVFSATFTFSEDVTGFVIGDVTLGNATASNFSQTSASVYTADITPTTDGTITIDVAANVAEDDATNGNTAATQFTVEADLTDPDVTITSSVVDPTNGTFSATFTFSEDVTGFVIGDITLGNATAINFAQTSLSVYTADITPTTDGTVTVDVAANVAEDAATNGNSAATQFSVEADFTPPTLTISSSVADPTNATFTTTFTFSEAVTGFTIGDITLGNASASNFIQTSPSVYTADITPTTDGTVTIDVAANVAEDAATNGNTAATQFNVQADYSTPTLIIDSGVNGLTNKAFTTTFTFSEAVTGFAIGDITLGNATTTRFSQATPLVYTAEITPTTDGIVTVDVAANVAEDAATNGNTAAPQHSVMADFTAPEVSIGNIPAELNDFDPFSLTFTFTEEVDGFEDSDIQLTNAQLKSFTTTDNIVFEVSLSAISNDEVTVSVPANTLDDLAGNPFESAEQLTITFNSLPTDISLSVLSIDENNALGDEIGQFTTADNDLGDVHTYSLVTGTGADDNNAFGITTDKLRAAEAFNFEAKSDYTIRVSTDDGRGGIFEKVFAITIKDVNEQPTDILLSNQIMEETDEERTSVGLLSTIDQDFGDDFSYELVEGNGSTHNARFAIVGDELFTSQMVNYEELEVLQIRVRTTDSGGLYFEKALEIAVVNVENEALRDFTKDEPDARIKNFFTPNGDGKNDVWVVDDIRDNPNNQVKVYSQNGQLVFSTNNYQNNWQGTYNGKQLPSGTYYYEINIANGMSIIKGTVLILTR